MQSTWRSVHSNWPSVHVHNIPTIPVTDIRSRQEKAIYYFWSRWKTELPKGLSSWGYLSPPVQTYSSSSARRRNTQSCGPSARARAPRPRPAPTPARQGRGRFLLASGPRATPPGCGSRAPAPRAPPKEGAGRGGAGARGPGRACARHRQPGLSLTPLIPPRAEAAALPGVEGVAERLLAPALPRPRPGSSPQTRLIAAPQFPRSAVGPPRPLAFLPAFLQRPRAQVSLPFAGRG